MREYVGVKLVKAEPSTMWKFKKGSPEDLEGKNEGIEGYKIIYKDGYESWTPKDVFEESYKPLDEMK